MADNERRGPENPTGQQGYEQLYPHPSQGLDRDAARARVEANPAVMPPSPTPSVTSSWKNKEVMGLRAMPLAMLLGAGLFIPFVMSLFKRREKDWVEMIPSGERAHGTTKKVGKKMKDEWKEAQGMPRFVILASRPWGRKGKRARALVMRKAGR